MFFPESEYLLVDCVAGKSAIAAVDGFLADGDRGREDVLDALLVARHTDQEPDEVASILTALSDRGTLAWQQMVRCPVENCGTLTPADRVERARTNGDDEPCDGPCGQNLAAVADLQVVDTYKLIAKPVL